MYNKKIMNIKFTTLNLLRVTKVTTMKSFTPELQTQILEIKNYTLSYLLKDEK